jgi:hypothetical protein
MPAALAAMRSCFRNKNDRRRLSSQDAPQARLHHRLGRTPMIRNPVFDFVTGAMLAMGGPMALVLPQRIFLEMLANAARAPVGREGRPRVS